MDFKHAFIDCQSDKESSDLFFFFFFFEVGEDVSLPLQSAFVFKGH